MAITYLSGQRIQGLGAIYPDSFGSSADATKGSAITLDTTNTPIFDKNSLDNSGASGTSEAIYTDGSDYLIPLGTADCSISFWLRPESVSGTQAIIRVQNSSGNASLECRMDSASIGAYDDTSLSAIATLTVNKWHHIAMRRTGNKDYWYVDGVVGSNWTSGRDSGTISSGYNEMHIIGRTTDSEHYTGQVCDVCFWNIAISTGNITSIFNSFDQDSATASDNTGLVATTVEPESIVAYYSCNSATVTNDAVGSEKDSVTDVPVGSQFEETDTRKFYQRSGLPVSTTGCKVYYNFNESSGDLINIATTANDFSDGTGSTNDGTVGSGVTRDVSGIIGNAYDFDGTTNGNVSIGSNVVSGTGAFSLSVWVYHDAESGSEGIIYLGGGEILLYSGSADKWHAMGVTGTSTATTATWYHLCVTRDGSSGLTLYVNGTSEATGTVGTSIGSGTTYIGGLTSGTEQWNGRIDELSVWDRELTSAEVTTIYNSGSGKQLNKNWIERGTAI